MSSAEFAQRVIKVKMPGTNQIPKFFSAYETFKVVRCLSLIHPISDIYHHYPECFDSVTPCHVLKFDQICLKSGA